MKAQGNEEEEAAITLGASGFKTFWYITLPNIKWGLLYGVILCNARAMGEFGAVSVVSGHIRGLLTPYHCILRFYIMSIILQQLFAAASLLALLAIVTLVVKKTLVEYKFRAELAALRKQELINHEY